MASSANAAPASIPTPGFRQRFRDRYKRWFEQILSRRGPLNPPFSLHYRQIFILPTRFGWFFGLLLFAMALGGLNFNNNLGLLLTFLLAGVGQLSMLLSFRNLLRLRIDQVAADDVFAGQHADFGILIVNPGLNNRPGIMVRYGKDTDLQHINAENSCQFHIKIPSRQRGWLTLDRFRVCTQYPLGMFNAWSWVKPELRCLVYPAPASNPPELPLDGKNGGTNSRVGTGEQLHGVREHQAGDGKHLVAWKVSARHRQLYSKVMEQPQSEQVLLDWYTLDGLEKEKRLSILCAWVLQAHAQSILWTLRLPDQQLGPSAGDEFRRHCLRALAMHP